MKNFMIGMHGGYDFAKFKRDFREGFYGVEACLFQSEDDIENLKIESKKKQFNYGIHFPLRGGISKLRDAQFLSMNDIRKIKAFEIIQKELEFIREKQLKPIYILFHFPKPSILKEDFDLNHWRFYDRSEYVYENEYPFSKFQENAEFLFKWLSEKSKEYDFTPVLEFDALNKYISNCDYVDNILNRYSNIKICLDIGRIHLQNKIDGEFNDVNIIKKFSKFTEVLHLWNVKVGTNTENSHFPALKTLKEEEGWAPVEKYLKIIKEDNPDVKILFEHRSDLITDEELYDCYEWIRSI